MSRPRVLVLLDHYLPGYKVGGPLRSIESLVEVLGDELEFLIAARDRDLGDAHPYRTVVPGGWQPSGKGRATYFGPGALGWRALRRFLRATPHDALYLNSLFSPRMTFRPLVLRRLRLVPRVPVVLAPRGELHPGALRMERQWRHGRMGRLLRTLRVPSLTKRLYIIAARYFGLVRGVVWQASGADELGDITRRMGPSSRVVEASDLVLAPGTAPAPREKRAGSLRLAFLSRIDEKKNLLGAVRALRRVRGEVSLEVFGPLQDEGYWQRCRAEAETLPDGVVVEYRGPVRHDQVQATLQGCHAFILPTWGENFGHAIVEALLAGCPVVISDRTPWRGLAAHRAGWDVPPEDEAAVAAAVQALVDMDQAAWCEWSRGAAALGRSIAIDPAAVDRNRRLFMGALSGGH
jgi:glycosyltransferase involved in cell wall biosynthesis